MQATSSHLDYGQPAPESRPREMGVAPGPDQRPAASAPRIVAIGGGTGLPVVLSGLSKRIAPSDAERAPRSSGRSDTLDRLTGVVTMTDDGGSSGRLRTELGVLPPGDVRNCLAALAGEGSPLADLMQHRFSGTNGLSGHAVGNLMLAALTQMNGDFTLAVDELSGILGLRGRGGVPPDAGQAIGCPSSSGGKRIHVLHPLPSHPSPRSLAGCVSRSFLHARRGRAGDQSFASEILGW